MKEYSASFHQNGNKKGLNGSKGASMEHNLRILEYRNPPNQAISQDIKVLRNLDLKETYYEIFNESTQRYNSNQKDERRIITSHYDKVADNKQKHLFQEMIFTIGKYEDRGTKEYEKEIKPKFEKVCERIVETLENEFSQNLKVVCAAIHYDEKGAYHMHLDYIPIAHGYKNGQDTQANMSKAYEEMGFKPSFAEKDKTPQILFEKYILDIYDRELNKENIKIKEHGKGRENSLTIEQYKTFKDEVKRNLEQERKFFSKDPTKLASYLQEKRQYEYDIDDENKKVYMKNNATLKATIEQAAYNNEYQKNIIEPKLKRAYAELHGKELVERQALQNEIKDLEKSKADIQAEQDELNSQLTNDKVLRDMAIEHLSQVEREKIKKLEKENELLAKQRDTAQREVRSYRATLESLAETCLEFRNPIGFIDRFTDICIRSWKYAESIIANFTDIFRAKQDEQDEKQAQQGDEGYHL